MIYARKSFADGVLTKLDSDVSTLIFNPTVVCQRATQLKIQSELSIDHQSIDHLLCVCMRWSDISM